MPGWQHERAGSSPALSERTAKLNFNQFHHQKFTDLTDEILGVDGQKSNVLSTFRFLCERKTETHNLGRRNSTRPSPQLEMEQQQQQRQGHHEEGQAVALPVVEDAPLFPVKKVVLSKTGIGYFERCDALGPLFPLLPLTSWRRWRRRSDGVGRTWWRAGGRSNCSSRAAT